MGNVLKRSLFYRKETQTKRRKEESTKRCQGLDIWFDSDRFIMSNGYENIDLTNTYELWDKKFDQKQMLNMKR